MTKKHCIALIVGIGYLVFFNSLLNGFVWDDDFQIVRNIAVHNGQLFYYFTHTIGPYYKPLMFLAYTIIYKIFHLNSFCYHFIQLSMHVTNAILIFLLFRHFFKTTFLSFLLALLFLVHPINGESVVYIADLQDVLFTFFGLFALLISSEQLLRKYSDIIASILLLLSLFSKETGMLFVAIYCIYVFFFRKVNRISAITYISGVTLLYFAIRFVFVGPIQPTNFTVIPHNIITAATMQERLMTIPKIIYFYLTTFVFPKDLTAQYWYVTSITPPDFILPLLFDLLVFGFFIGIGRYLALRQKSIASYFWFFFLWFVIGLLFHLQLLPLDKTVAIRWFYFPMIGLLGMFLPILRLWRIKNTLVKNGVVILFIGTLTIFAFRSIIRNTNWYSDLTLFSHDITSLENVADIQYNYGTALIENGQYDKAIVHLQKAAQLSPNSFMIWHNLAISYLHANKFDEAKESYTRVIQLTNTDVVAYRGIVLISLLQNKPAEAKDIAQSYLEQWPDDPYLWRMLGIAAYTLHDKKLATSAFQKSSSLLADPVTSYYQQQLDYNLPIEMKEF